MNPHPFAIELAKAGYHQARNAWRLVRGWPLTTPPLGSVTLGPDDAAIARSQLELRDGWLDEAAVEEYERAFAEWNGSGYACAFMGGRVALSACIDALGLGPGDEVIVPGYTCVVVPNAFEFARVKVRYADVELDTYGLDAAALERAVTPDTKAVLLHHLYGLVCRDYEKVVDFARASRLRVIEDCGQAAGAEFKGRKVGNLGDLAFYSTEQSKVFTTIEGGLATSNDPELAGRLEEYKARAPFPDAVRIQNELVNVFVNYNASVAPGRWWRGDLARLRYRNRLVVSTTPEEELGIKPAGYGCRMPAPLARLGLNQLSKVDRHNVRRRESARRWDAWCDENGYAKPVVVPDSVPVFLRYPVLVEPEKKKDTSWAYRELGVNLGVWFETNVHPAQRRVEGCPNADEAVRRCVNFPTGEGF